MVDQSMSDIHESTSCKLGADGEPCDLCRWANESAATQDRVALRADMARDRQYASLTVMRAAIYDVIDSGDQDGQQWALYEHDHVGNFPCWTEDEASHERELFVDAVCARVTTLQAPPFNFDAGLREESKERSI